MEAADELLQRRLLQSDYYRGDRVPVISRWSCESDRGFIPGVGPLIQAGGEALSKIGTSKAIVKAIPRAAGPVTSVLGKLKGGVLKHPVLTGAGAAGLAGAAAASPAPSFSHAAVACEKDGECVPLTRRRCGARSVVRTPSSASL